MFDGLVKDSQRALGWGLPKKVKVVKESVGESLSEFKKNGKENLELAGVLPPEEHPHLQELQRQDEHSIVLEEGHKPAHIEKLLTIEDKLNGHTLIESSNESKSVFNEHSLPPVINASASLLKIQRLHRLSPLTNKYLEVLLKITNGNPYSTNIVYPEIQRRLGRDGNFVTSHNRFLTLAGVVRDVGKSEITKAHNYEWNPDYLVLKGDEKFYPLSPASKSKIRIPTIISDDNNARLARVESSLNTLLTLNKEKLGLDAETRSILMGLEGQEITGWKELSDINVEFDQSLTELEDDADSALAEKRLYDYVELSKIIISRYQRMVYRHHYLHQISANIRAITYKLIGIKYTSIAEKEVGVQGGKKAEDERGEEGL